VKINKIISIFVKFSLLLAAIAQPVIAAQIQSGSQAVKSTTQSSALSDPAEFEAFLDTYLAEQMATHHIPGVVFTMVKDGKVFFSKAYGYADLEDRTPMDTTETMLTTASQAKLFTGIGVL